MNRHTGKTRPWSLLKKPAYKGVAPSRPQLRTQRGDPKTPRRSGSIYDIEPNEQVSIAVSVIVAERLFAAVQEQFTENCLHGRE